ncbi:MAG: 4Fe-4S dicluster domain-containing protein [Ignavibacteria bacterium]|nr:4Fe-4S dicluster domain-containing protein [Ignavibacteria bacterium]
MPSLQHVVKDLLASGAVEVVIGYEKAPGQNRTRPFFARTPEDADRLVFDFSALNNLAVYLTRQKRPAKGKIGIVAKGCDARAITMLMQEQQLTRDDVHVIGMECSGVTAEMGADLSKDTLAAKCVTCKVQTPPLADTLVEGPKDYERPDDRNGARMRELEAMTPEQRFAFWAGEFDRCVRCYACRQACPMCYCEQCVAEKNQPQWIETSATLRGNIAWNVIRAFHLGGRCVGCNECERACPADIPLGLLNRKLGMVAGQEFGYAAGMDASAPTLVGTWDKSDRQEYIK